MSLKILSIFVLSILLSLYGKVAFAISAPEFSSCLNVTGQMIAHYPDGIHGIAGDTTTHTGQDSVFDLGGGRFTQCFCPATGAGIQTDWWNAAKLSHDDIERMKASDWIYIPTGSVWGLTDDPYLAHNTFFQCTNAVGGGQVNADTDNGQANQESTSNIGGGQILGDEMGEVLGLAATGDIWKLYTAFGVGFALILIGIYRLKKSSVV